MRPPPTTAKGRATVQRVLEAACELFARQGIRSTTLDAVQTASGTGRSQLYRYFTGKADLVTAVVNQQVERVLTAQQPLLGSIATAADVRQWCDLAARQYADDDPVRCPIGSLVHELGEQDPAARAALAAGLSRWHAALATGLRRVRDNGELAARVDPDEAAAALLSSYQGGVLLAAATGDLALLTASVMTVAGAILADTPPAPRVPARPMTGNYPDHVESRGAEPSVIRRAATDDLTVLLPMIMEFYDIDRHPFDRDKVITALEPLLTDDAHGQVWVILDPARPDHVVGYAVVTWSWSLESGGRDCILDELYVRDRGRGLGTAALHEALRAAAAGGAKAMFLETEAHNVRVRGLYARSGFSTEDSVWMTRSLDPGPPRPPTHDHPSTATDGRCACAAHT